MYWGYSNKTNLFGSTDSSHKLEVDITSERTPINVVIKLIPQRNENKGRLPMFCKPGDNSILLDTDKPEYSSFDNVFTSTATADDMYNYFHSDLNYTQDVLNAYNLTLITYGQSFTGKTSALWGIPDKDIVADGLVQKFSKELFEKIDIERKEHGTKSVVNLKVFEVNMEKIHDMLIPDGMKKSLKLHHEANKVEYSVKDLSNCVVSSTEDIILEMSNVAKRRNVNSNKSTRSKTHLFVKILVEQRNIIDETLKTGSLLFIDLCGSNLLNKDVDKSFSSDEIRKLNTELKAMNNVINTLSDHQTKHPDDKREHSIPYKESNLTKLLLNPLTGNSITTFLICCSTDKDDEVNSLNSLRIGSTIKTINTSIHANIVGLHQKKKMDLLYENTKKKEDNYLKRIQQLELERDALRKNVCNSVENTSTSSMFQKLQKSEAENKALIEQLELLKGILSGQSKETLKSSPQPNGNIMDITKSLIEKSSKVAELQASIEEMNHLNYKLKAKIKDMGGKDSNLENMNTKLVLQIKEHECLIQKLLTANAAMESELDHFKEINKVRIDKVKILEDRISKSNIHNGAYDSSAETPRQGSVSSSSGHTIIPIDEGKEIGASPWGLKNPVNNGWGNRQASVGSIGISTSEETFVPRPLKKGLKLNSVRVVSGPATTPHMTNGKI
ncbi:similar to Saccharomyces cerevisiae YKL079W SMY1 Protein that interacts with Myo2p, proposed to be involved in exocytosis [Maudiozyma saulgeensis]|uniref:Similar to Saccharomyces cerevisiae YKL079W SMY1 Protein that interacts with Myo2p, proposed to be involved in exocytosis n=1 Tax=Maudiozyma saulgeensis TaxID=1789683 RepID=A0A1X7QXP2_9SACH|nr:similar to Saccharomyces cerevisiae YKL079W SMY1 Protein that interacts with Myo2p, proposed to be involved in exocytosis [Kazachstania saulgeensis]